MCQGNEAVNQVDGSFTNFSQIREANKLWQRARPLDTWQDWGRNERLIWGQGVNVWSRIQTKPTRLEEVYTRTGIACLQILKLPKSDYTDLGQIRVFHAYSITLTDYSCFHFPLSPLFLTQYNTCKSSVLIQPRTDSPIWQKVPENPATQAQMYPL